MKKILLALLLTSTVGAASCGDVRSEEPAWNTYMVESDILDALDARVEYPFRDHMDDYGGVYFDEHGVAVVLFLENSEVFREAAAELTGNRDGRIAVASVKYTAAQMEAVQERIREFFPFLGDFVMRETGLDISENHIKIGVEEGTDLAAFTDALLTELNMPEIQADFFDIYEYDSADDVWYTRGESSS